MIALSIFMINFSYNLYRSLLKMLLTSFFVFIKRKGFSIALLFFVVAIYSFTTMCRPKLLVIGMKFNIDSDLSVTEKILTIWRRNINICRFLEVQNCVIHFLKKVLIKANKPTLDKKKFRPCLVLALRTAISFPKKSY